MTVKNWTNWPIDIHEEPEQIQRMLEKLNLSKLTLIFKLVYQKMVTLHPYKIVSPN